MRTSRHRIYTVDNLELVGLLYEPDEPTTKVLVHVHGMAGNFYENKFLDHIAETLTANGSAFFVFNNRGCEFVKDLYRKENGVRSIVQIGNAYEKFEDSVLDIKAAIDFVADRGFSDIHLEGHSLGSPKVTFYVTQTKDTRVKSLLLLSPSDMLGLVRANPERFKEDLTEAKNLVAEGRGRDLLTHKVWDECPVSAETYLSLFADDSKAGIFAFFDPEASFATLAEVTIPVFAVMGRKDDALTVPIEETYERLSAALSSSPRIETKILGDANHGYLGDEQVLADAVKAWLL